ncbi:MAG: hypothetical protein NPINA01_00570 [Nitrospinaceae bacterium]|nr:MAG: hypothetical protein NPINA01_00570 [Nitrospinaceae bacterium]
MKLKFFPWLILTIGLLLPLELSEAGEYQRLKTQAEKYYAKGSFSRAHKTYAETNALNLNAKERRWVDFRIGDTLWRAQAGSKTSDSSTYDKARQQLEFLIRDVKRDEDKDRVWAEIQESLGDFWWQRRDSKNWHASWKHYREALEWWAGARDIELARSRYLNIIWTIASPPWREPYYYYGYYGNRVPLETLENALKISQTPKDRTRAHYLIAMTLRHQGGNQQERVAEEFQAVLKAGKSFEWYDDALFQYAEWLANYGEIIILKNGDQRREKNYVAALELYRRILKEFKKGETRHYDPAKQRIKDITQPVLGLGVGNIFLPGSEIQFHLNWRNIENVVYSIYPVDLTRDVEFADGKNARQWIQQINLPLKNKLLSRSETTESQGDYHPGQKILRLKKSLPKGAYLIEATGGGKRARDLILVTDSSLVLKSSGTQALVYFCNAVDGSPISKAEVTLWERHYTGRKWVWKDHRAETDEKGLAIFKLRNSRHNGDLFASAASNDRQAYSLGHSQKFYRQHTDWKVYVFTDRPAYRPKETAHWKVIARGYDGSVYSTPSNEAIEYRITDPRGSKLKEGTLKLNEFGSAWDSLDLGESLPLGAYQVSFWDKGKKKSIGHSTLFRLEEYKLPEFKVSLKTPEVDGKKKTFQLGDKVEVELSAEYYFGGPVANADVEVLIYQRPFRQYWRPPPEYPWYYGDMHPQPSRFWGGRGQQVKREVLKTDAMGFATLTLDTPRNSQDLEYSIEARVIDASRREIVATDKIRVTRQPYAIFLNPEHNIFRPQDKVQINIHSVDANSQPVQANGIVRVTREYWFEIWLDPEGREVKGDALKKLREKTAIFPPPPSPGKPSWELKFRGTEYDDILTRSVKTDAEGKAEFTYTAEREGHYRVEWTGQEKGTYPVKGATTVWVATQATTDLNTRHGGLEIIVDKDTFRAGQKAPVMLMAPTNDRHVLFSVEGDDLYHHQLVHMEGPVKLLELDITEEHIPNLFLNAVMVSDRQMFQDSKQVIVPPVKNFLEVKVESDRESYQPQEEGTLTVTTRDSDGNPVSAEVALGLVDASVFYIQKDLAPDPRQFFFGQKRVQRPRTQSTFQSKRYLKLVEGERGDLLDEKELRRQKAGASTFYELKGRSEGGLRRDFVQKAPKSALYKREGGKFSDDSIPQAVAESSSRMEMEEDSRGGGAGAEPAVQVRADFRATAFWQPNLITNKMGKAEIRVKFPDSLTEWRATARAVANNNRFGIGSTNSRTRKPLIVRLQAPRFFVVGDALTISAIINNNTDETMKVDPSISLEGVTLKEGKFQALEVPAGGEKRIDWQVVIDRPGSAKIRVTAQSKKYGDGMEKSFPVFEHGLEKFMAKSGKMHGDAVDVTIDLPKERKKKSTQLTIQAAPSLAVTLLDSLPYLIDFPYGCTEQTMSRFLPAVITAKTLKDLGLDPESIEGRIFGGIETGATEKTHAKGKKDLRSLNQMVAKGLERLYDFQHGDGGWGWWKKSESDPFMSAYVLWGLVLAKNAGIDVDRDVMNRASDFLNRELVEEEERFDQQAWMLHALASAHDLSRKHKISEFQSKAFDNLWNNRSKLNAYTRSLLAVTAHYFGVDKKARTLIENLENGVKIDRTPDTSIVQRGEQTSGKHVLSTAHWGEDGIYWRWSEGGVEATAFALRALVLIDPDNKLVEPVTNWLVKNRRGSHWSNTRNTAIAVLALNDYLVESGELQADLEYELLLNGQSIARTKVKDVLSAPSLYTVNKQLIRDGANTLQILRKNGKGPLYFSLRAKYFSLEEPVPPAGNEMFLRRQYYKLVGRPTLLKGLVYDKIPLNDGDSIASGERVETLITLEAKNNYEYLVIEDLKPAGFESVQIKSGESLYAKELKSAALDLKLKKPGRPSDEFSSRAVIPKPPGGAEESDYTGRTQWVYQELRDRKIALFIDKLPQGVWEIRTSQRAEVPGRFHALPVLGHAMYIPEIRANGAEIRVTVKDRGQK